MGRFVFAFLILSGIFAVQSMADRSGLKNQKLVHLSSKTEKSFIADSPAVNEADHQSMRSKEGDHNEEIVAAEAPEFVVRKISKHHSTDKSVAGGGVIIGGLVTAIFAAVYCYIRVTRKTTSSSSSHTEQH